MKSILKLETIIFALSSALIGIPLNIVASFIFDEGSTWILPTILAAFLVGLVGLYFKTRPKLVEGVLRSPHTLRTPVERLSNARRGIIVFVSLYKPILEGPAQQLSPNERRAAAEKFDYETLDLEKSNLATAIASITSHLSKLEYCWLISTTASDGKQYGSYLYAPVLIRYLKEKKGLRNCKFFGDIEKSYAVPLDDDALVANKTLKMVKEIFAQATRLGLSDAEIIADFSGCPRSMTLGMFAACLDGRRDIQFAGTRYDELARPTGGIIPIVFNVEAVLPPNQ